MKPQGKLQEGWFKGLCLFAVFFGLCFSAFATVMVRLDLNDLVQSSTWIVEGVVEEVDKSAPTQQGGVETRVRVRIVSRWKGPESRGHLTLRLPGGERDGTVTRVAGMPVFQIGEEVLLFLEPVAGGWIPTGLGQGVFRLVHFENEKTVSQVAGEGMYLEQGKQGSWVQTGSPSPTVNVPLLQFRSEVEEMMSGADSRPRVGNIPTILP